MVCSRAMRPGQGHGTAHSKTARASGADFQRRTHQFAAILHDAEPEAVHFRLWGAPSPAVVLDLEAKGAIVRPQRQCHLPGAAMLDSVGDRLLGDAEQV